MRSKVSGSRVWRPSVITSTSMCGGTTVAWGTVIDRVSTSSGWTKGTQAMRSASTERIVAASRPRALGRSGVPSWASTM
jgi:hypothetical protein